MDIDILQHLKSLFVSPCRTLPVLCVERAYVHNTGKPGYEASRTVQPFAVVNDL